MTNKKFKILLIEDEEEISSFISEELSKVDKKRIEIIIANNKQDAITLIQSSDNFFDLISLDLQIPTRDGLMDKSPEHGLSVLSEAKSFATGTPIIILTGTSTVEMINSFLQYAHNEQIWQDGIIYPTTSHYSKSDLNKYLVFLQKIYNSILGLFNIELEFNDTDKLSIEHDRLIRIFVKKVNGLKVNVKKIGGGLSNSTVYSLLVYDNLGKLIHQTIAKCGEKEEINKDSRNYVDFIHRLSQTVTPRKLAHILFGAKDQSGVFYELASNYPYSYFNSTKNGLNNKDIRNSIEKLTENWQNNASIVSTTIKELREELVSDDIALDLFKFYKLEWAEEFEKTTVQIKRGICHGDLHGENILINISENNSTLIDYGDIKENCSITIDPITLECSFLFHPSCDKYEWPTIDHIKKWQNIDEYIKDCPIYEEIIFCRNWLKRIKASNREIAAILYTYTLRQLKYKDTNKEIALELLNTANEMIENS